MGGSILVVDNNGRFATSSWQFSGQRRLSASRAQRISGGETLMRGARRPGRCWSCPAWNAGLTFARQLRADQRTAASASSPSARAGGIRSGRGARSRAPTISCRSHFPRGSSWRASRQSCGDGRRSSPDEVVQMDGLRLDPAAHHGPSMSRTSRCGPTEFRLLHFFMTHPGRVSAAANCSMKSGATGSSWRNVRWTCTFAPAASTGGERTQFADRAPCAA